MYSDIDGPSYSVTDGSVQGRWRGEGLWKGLYRVCAEGTFV